MAGMISDLMSMVSLSGDEDIVQQQKMICQRIVMLENQRYNEQLQFLNDIMISMQKDIDRVREQARNSNTNGKMDTNGVVATVVQQQMDKDIETGKTKYEIYGEMIESLETQQKNLARIAMNGKTSIIGTIANTAILAAALKVNE